MASDDLAKSPGMSSTRSAKEFRGYLALAKLMPVVRDQVLGMTTVTANELVIEEKLRFIACERNQAMQRRIYERLLTGQLRCTRAEMGRGTVAVDLRRLPSAPAKPEQTLAPMEVRSITLAIG
jgi:hypothetical protein